jgi:hypothetical protein
LRSTTRRDSASRVFLDESADPALAFLVALERFYLEHGITVERVLTDNGTCFNSRWSDACEQRAIGVRKTRPPTGRRPTARPTPIVSIA